MKAILIANRGEIARRIIRTCRSMGIRSIAVYADADRHAPYVQEADTAFSLEGNQPSDTYLHIEKLMAAAKATGADAVHPGYGFLSENAAFAQRCIDEGLTFIGPHPEAIAKMGSKSEAKALMEAHGVPIIPGYRGKEQSEEKLSEEALRIGFPVLIKAAAGGGGKGMRIVNQSTALKEAILSAKREAANAFGDDELLVEKYFPSSRHIEFQIFGDKHGNAIHLLERECSIQRRYQKIIEESPSPALSDSLREQMGNAAVKAAKALQYDNAGTVEFILTDENEFYFLEVNTRLQVEHPVTEAITGLDLVKLQIESAEGKPLSIKQEEIKANGYALECRLYAEDAAQNFMPATGKVLLWDTPNIEGMRYDSGIETGSAVSIFYDPMIAKIIAHDTDRQATIRKMTYALQNTSCLGITTNKDFLLHLLSKEDFQAGNYDTHFIQNRIDLNAFQQERINHISEDCIALVLYRWAERNHQRKLLTALPSGWRNSFNQPQQENCQVYGQTLAVKYRQVKEVFNFWIADQVYQVNLENTDLNSIRLTINGKQVTYQVATENHKEYFLQSIENGTARIEILDRFPNTTSSKAEGGYHAPMPAEVVSVLVNEGQTVKSGDALVVLSSMKMENTITAFEDGTVQELFVKTGDNIEAGRTLLTLSKEAIPVIE
ncbi:biotin carboxylase N-terminal domain-containing protein [Limibacter armeniacum]|uniref:acetyl/propionyl/methylcrotonyl-CoA carboxylase subunit alpha n=1 Tax=Limibacter armeniacum TaxID=466084 RepID=UPI002FE638C5